MLWEFPRASNPYEADVGNRSGAKPECCHNGMLPRWNAAKIKCSLEGMLLRSIMQRQNAAKEDYKGKMLQKNAAKNGMRRGWHIKSQMKRA